MADQLFRIYHPKTKKWRDVWAPDATRAVAIAGWKRADCEIRVRTENGGWKKVEAE
jgi:hypothetical protein